MNFKEWLISEIATRTRLPSDAVTDKGNMYGIPFGSTKTQSYVAAAGTGLVGGIGLGVRRAQDRSGVVIRPSPQSEDLPNALNKKIPNGISLPLQLPALERREGEGYNRPVYLINSSSWKAVENEVHNPRTDPRVRKVGEPWREGIHFIQPAAGNQGELDFAISFTRTLIQIMTVWEMYNLNPQELNKYDFANANVESQRVDADNVLTCVFSFKRRDNVPDSVKQQNFE